MKGKGIAAGLLVSIVSVALAIGITYAVTSNHNNPKASLSVVTPAPLLDQSPVPTATLGPGDPQATPTATPSSNCTFPADIWMQFPDVWKIDSYRLGEKVYTQADMLDILRRSSNAPRDRLLSQIIVVLLNQQNGADATSVRTSFSQAVSWLQKFPDGSKPADGDLQQAEALALSMERFNDGLLEPQPCQYNLSGSTPVVVPTQSIQMTSTPLPIITVIIYPSPTSQPKDPPKKPKPTSPPPPKPLPTEPMPTSVPLPTQPPPPPPPEPPPTQPPADPPPTDPPPTASPSNLTSLARYLPSFQVNPPLILFVGMQIS